MDLSGLDRAEFEVNKVLEQIGRMIMNAKQGNKGTTLAIATRLRQTVPISTGNFHNALDELDQQIQLAKSIMRRDLAVLQQPEISQQAPVINEEKTDASVTVKPNLEAEGSESFGTAEDTKLTTTADNVEEANSTKQTSNTAAKEESPPEAAAENAASTTTADDNKQSLEEETGLKLDTMPGDDGTVADKAPDTAFSANADLDSLFNDPLTAATENGPAVDPDFDLTSAGNDANAFDLNTFTDFGTDGQIEGLQHDLGLQNYASDTDGLQDPIFDTFETDVNQDDAMMDVGDIFNFDNDMDIDVTNPDGENADATLQIGLS